MSTVSRGPVQEFCASLKEQWQASRRELATVARELAVSRSQLYAVVNGQIKRPPDWDTLVQPFLRACGVQAKEELESWRRRHDVMVRVHEELGRHRRAGSQSTGGDEQVTPPSPADTPATTAPLSDNGDNIEPVPHDLPDATQAQRSRWPVGGRKEKRNLIAHASAAMVVVLIIGAAALWMTRGRSPQPVTPMKISVLTPQDVPIARCPQLDVSAPAVTGYTLWGSWHSRVGEYYFRPLAQIGPSRWRLTATIGNTQEAGQSWEFDFFYATPQLDSTLITALRYSDSGDTPHLLGVPAEARGLQRITLVRRLTPQDPAC